MNPAEINRLAAARAGNQHEFSYLTEPYRRELQLHCYRMLGSLQDAEDLVQETLLRAWRRLDTFEGRASLRAWLYKIATNACLDTLEKRPKRVLPLDAYPPSMPGQPFAPPILDPIWLEPFPDDSLPEVAQTSPEARYTLRESITLAFMAALHLLPPRQRAVLILRDVLDWHADEAAELLETTVSAVNSALHRARVTLARHYHHSDPLAPPPANDTLRALLNRYIQAWEAADVPTLIALLKEDAVATMPPSPTWYQGREAISAFMVPAFFTGAAADRWRLKPTWANTHPACGIYERDEAGGVYRPLALQVLVFTGEQIAHITAFLTPTLFPRFNLPQELY